MRFRDIKIWHGLSLVNKDSCMCLKQVACGTWKYCDYSRDGCYNPQRRKMSAHNNLKGHFYRKIRSNKKYYTDHPEDRLISAKSEYSNPVSKIKEVLPRRLISSYKEKRLRR